MYGSDNDEGDKKDDTISCESNCKGWIQQRCMGMTKLVYDTLTSSEDTYVCTCAQLQIAPYLN